MEADSDKAALLHLWSYWVEFLMTSKKNSIGNLCKFLDPVFQGKACAGPLEAFGGQIQHFHWKSKSFSSKSCVPGGAGFVKII